MQIEVERARDDGLTRDLWRFTSWMNHGGGVQIRLDLWEPQGRKSPRHKWAKSGEGYKHRSHNGRVHFGGYMTPAADVPLPTDVVAQAKMAVFESVIVTGAVDPVEKRHA